MGWLAAKKSAGANTKRTNGGQDPCRSDEEALWTQASEDGEVGMVVSMVVVMEAWWVMRRRTWGVMVVVGRERVRRGPWLYTVKGALRGALPDVCFVPASRLAMAVRVRIRFFALSRKPNRG